MYSGICDAIHSEMDRMEEKYANGAQISEVDLVNIDRMAHALKSIATYEAMQEYGDRGRSRTRYRDDRYDGYRRY